MAMQRPLLTRDVTSRQRGTIAALCELRRHAPVLVLKGMLSEPGVEFHHGVPTRDHAGGGSTEAPLIGFDNWPRARDGDGGARRRLWLTRVAFVAEWPFALARHAT